MLLNRGSIYVYIWEGTYRWHFTNLECVDDAVYLKLSVDVGFLLLDVGWFVYACHDGVGICR